LCGLLGEHRCGGKLAFGDTCLTVLAGFSIGTESGLGKGVLVVWLSCLGRVLDGPIGRCLPAVLVVAELWIVLLPDVVHWVSPCCSKIGLSDPPSLSTQSIIHIVVGAFSYKLMLRPILEDFFIIKGLHLVVGLEVVGLAYTTRRALVVSDRAVSPKGFQTVATAIEVLLETRVIRRELMSKGVVALGAGLPVLLYQLRFPLA
jgi:hypothetical protein